MVSNGVDRVKVSTRRNRFVQRANLLRYNDAPCIWAPNIVF